MPRGITQEQVTAVADAIVATGERPTLGKMRAHLGTGSPNTVTKCSTLGGRGLPIGYGSPANFPIFQMASGKRCPACACGHWRRNRRATSLQSELQADRVRLEQEKSAFIERDAEQASALTAMQAHVNRSDEAVRLADTETAALQRLVERLESEIEDHVKGRHRLIMRNDFLLTSEAKLRAQPSAIEDRSAYLIMLVAHHFLPGRGLVLCLVGPAVCFDEFLLMRRQALQSMVESACRRNVTFT